MISMDQAPDPTRGKPASGSPFRHAVRESMTILITWVVFCVWVVGASWWLGYRPGPSSGVADGGQKLRLVAGIPAWAFWSVMVPWAAAVGFTLWFCLRGMDRQEEETMAEPLPSREGKSS